MTHRTRSSKRAATLVETLVATLILGLCLLAALSLFGFSMSMTEKTGDSGVAYNLARRTLENARATGFRYQNTPEGAVTSYYDAMGGSASSTQASSHRFRVVRTVTSDRFSTTAGGPVPSDTSIRAVIVEVYTLPENVLSHRVGTHLVRSGV